jgi:hypothetical protein
MSSCKKDISKSEISESAYKAKLQALLHYTDMGQANNNETPSDFKSYKDAYLYFIQFFKELASTSLETTASSTINTGGGDNLSLEGGIVPWVGGYFYVGNMLATRTVGGTYYTGKIQFNYHIEVQYSYSGTIASVVSNIPSNPGIYLQAVGSISTQSSHINNNGITSKTGTFGGSAQCTTTVAGTTVSWYLNYSGNYVFQNPTSPGGSLIIGTTITSASAS